MHIQRQVFQMKQLVYILLFLNHDIHLDVAATLMFKYKELFIQKNLTVLEISSASSSVNIIFLTVFYCIVPCSEVQLWVLVLRTCNSLPGSCNIQKQRPYLFFVLDLWGPTHDLCKISLPIVVELFKLLMSTEVSTETYWSNMALSVVQKKTFSFVSHTSQDHAQR